MSKIKKVLAVFLTLAMVLGMGVTTFAAEGQIPTKNDTMKATVNNVEEGATVTAYQIVKADYNSNGFYGYSEVLPGTIANVLSTTSSEITALAGKTTELPDSVVMTPGQANADGLCAYSADLKAGSWMVLVRGSKEVYNPMLLSVYYSKSGSDNTMSGDPVDANTNWTLETTNAYAKSSDVPITKTADKETANLGETVGFTIKTIVPSYSDEYTTVKFDVKDTVTGLSAPTDIKVVSDLAITDNDYTITPGSDTFTVSFNSTWIKANGGANITITYNATITGDAVNQDPHSNDAELIYTNNPGEDNGSNKDHQKVYTFDIDGDVTKDILKKVQPGKEELSKEALAGAEFTLYTDENCTVQYTNTKHTADKATAVSDGNGKIYITGLAVGTYYLKETKAPEGFSLNDTIYQVDIAATIVNEELENWSITITNKATGDDMTNDFTVSNGNATPGAGNQPTDIMNTKISSLPSTGGIGTTIFTIGGCLIMIIAAALFFASRRKNNK